MEILITGDIAAINSSFSAPLAKKHKIAAAQKGTTSAIGRGINTYNLSPHDEGFEKLFNSYSFDYVLFFSQHPSETPAYYDELQDLECCLSYCDRFDIKKFFYISSTSVFAGQDLVDESSTPVALNGTCYILQTCEQLCSIYNETRGFNVQIIRIPSLYAPDESISFIGRAVSSAIKEGAVYFPGLPEQKCDFLSQRDLAILIDRMIDSPDESIKVMHAPGGCQMTFEELGALMTSEFPTLRVTYSKTPAMITERVGAEIARREYDWIALDNAKEELSSIISERTTDSERDGAGIIKKISRFFENKKIILKIVEVVLGFILMELLNYYSKTTIQFRYIDFRLLYVLLISIIHGMKTGLAASGLAVFSLIISHITQGSDWRIIVYNIDGWLPFIMYVILATAVGYTKDKMVNDNEAVSEELKNLEEKYVLINEFYAGAISNKGLYRNQIMSYKDTFGRIFEVAKRFDTVVPEELFNEAIASLEEILENQSICIYGFYSSQVYGRLVVCSQKILNTTPKSLNLDELSFLKNQLKENEVWKNSERMRHYPEYAYPIFNNGELAALITIQKARYEQLSVYYENMIKVLCGLMQISLIRAIEYEKAAHDKIYWEGTEIMKPEYFKDYLFAQMKKAESLTGEYTLLKIEVIESNIEKTGNLLRKCIRENDVVGTDNAGGLYLCLSQMNSNNIKIVVDRLRKKGFIFDTVYGGNGQ